MSAPSTLDDSQLKELGISIKENKAPYTLQDFEAKTTLFTIDNKFNTKLLNNEIQIKMFDWLSPKGDYVSFQGRIRLPSNHLSLLQEILSKILWKNNNEDLKLDILLNEYVHKIKEVNNNLKNREILNKDFITLFENLLNALNKDNFNMFFYDKFRNFYSVLWSEELYNKLFARKNDYITKIRNTRNKFVEHHDIDKSTDITPNDGTIEFKMNIDKKEYKLWFSPVFDLCVFLVELERAQK